MDCNAAREILQSVYDGDQPADMVQAQEHVLICEECREWKTEMDNLLSSICLDASELPETDISTVVMSKLPQRHPTAVMQTKWSLGRTLAWTLACWIVGVLVLIGGVGVLMLVTGNDGIATVSGVCRNAANLLHWAVTQLAVAAIALKALWHAGGLLIVHLFEVALSMKWTLGLFCLVDAFLLVVGFTALRRKVWSRPLMMI